SDFWTEKFEEEIVDLMKEAVELEKIYAEEACPEEVLGMGPDQFKEYVEYIADRRFEQLNLDRQYGTENPFPWMTEQIDLNKEKNFFETNVTEYQEGGQLDWD
ncbi:MAG: ribonucleotide-diphosphate reductase subunit beta, partial [Nanohaloarchaea archaeon SW_7_46_7]